MIASTPQYAYEIVHFGSLKKIPLTSNQGTISNISLKFTFLGKSTITCCKDNNQCMRLNFFAKISVIKICTLEILKS